MQQPRTEVVQAAEYLRLQARKRLRAVEMSAQGSTLVDIALMLGTTKRGAKRYLTEGLILCAKMQDPSSLLDSPDSASSCQDASP